MQTLEGGIKDTRDELLEIYQAELDLKADTILEANRILTNVIEEDLATSRCHKTITAACALLACRETSVPRVADDFAQYTIKNGDPLAAKDVSKEARRIKRELRLNLEPIKPKQYLEYYADKLELSPKAREQAQNFLDLADDTGMTNGPSPTSIAAACIDAARRLTDEDIYQTDISQVSHVSEPQMRKHRRNIISHAGGETA